MTKNKLPPLAVTVELPDNQDGTYREGQEVILTFHAVPEWLESVLGWALQAVGWTLEKRGGQGGDIICHVPVTQDLTTCAPAHIEGGRMRYSSRAPLFTSDGY
ncbi:hypothetical protein HY480_00380 [Candidatus Uhrbacteria bacterium]|nr:hypothetical protein [Candidatus Uhrbacteria bacterium]